MPINISGPKFLIFVASVMVILKIIKEVFIVPNIVPQPKLSGLH